LIKVTETQLRIDRLQLQDVGGFREMDITFGPSLSIICGPNGVGKTTVLDAIASAFVVNHMMMALRRRAGSDQGIVKYSAIVRGTAIRGTGTLKNFHPTEQAPPFGHGEDTSTNLIYLKSTRDFGYTRLDGVLRDPDTQSFQHQQAALDGIAVADVKQWFSNRYLMEPHGAKWPQYRLNNLALAKTFFSLLDAEVVLSHVDSSTFEIFLDTPSGKIPFEYMSAGFRTSYGLIFGILKEIEFRKLNVSANEFTGLILVDELDLHLHPTWHGPMLRALEAAYPRSQIIVSTHSPHMIQNARPDNLIILPRFGNVPRKLEGVDPEFGLIGWTVEEILRDVMGMEDPRPPAFAKMMETYENAVTRRNKQAVEEAKAKVLRALHPSSLVRQIIEIDTI
jgi:hypothetical protein